MSLTRDDVRRVAALARLRLSPEDEATFAAQLGRVIDYIDQLARFATAPPDPLELRAPPPVADDARPGLPLETFLGNAPAARPPYLMVPRVLASEDA
jgi:aspartyl-tRNA(Asn)/glutamyl-tRNA(Gln) amidotransferase subunit C